ncbi:MAG: hypothetical protein INQ03_05405 [Candidatus Heimdallarchaeota archaeon]|nr:hypothetical protein [Candidatus Heimdallarchaeota archaeon]
MSGHLLRFLLSQLRTASCQHGPVRVVCSIPNLNLSSVRRRLASLRKPAQFQTRLIGPCFNALKELLSRSGLPPQIPHRSAIERSAAVKRKEGPSFPSSDTHD